MPTAETQKTSLEVFFLCGRTAAQLPLCECTSILLVIIPSRACELTRAVYTRSHTRGGAGGGRQRENKRMPCSRCFILLGMPQRCGTGHREEGRCTQRSGSGLIHALGWFRSSPPPNSTHLNVAEDRAGAASGWDRGGAAALARSEFGQKPHRDGGEVPWPGPGGSDRPGTGSAGLGRFELPRW